MNRSVFISYARKDGRELALHLQRDLIASDFSVWLDTSEIEGGASWSSEIEDAIENCHVVIALLSHGSFVSEICRAEQLRSLRKGKPVVPVLVQSNAERPLYLEHLNYRDFTDNSLYRDNFETLKSDLLSDENTPLPEIRKQTNVSAPPLPPHFIARKNELQRLRQTVLGDETDSHIALTALRGMGGIGKSVLATALCHDEVIQAAFPDGIIWVTIGREPGNLTEQMKFIGMKLNDSPGYYTTEDAGRDRLQTILVDKATLLVLDDVWDASHIMPFRINAPRCRTLFTTRDGGVALTVGASEVRLGTLNKQQSLELLREWAGRTEPSLAQIAERLGYLPLALKLAGARLREGMKGEDWLQTFQHVSQMKLGRRSRDPHENLEVCFDLSVQQLVQEDQLLYHAVGVFAEDVEIPQSVVVKLWRQLDPSLSEYDGQELAYDLARLALIDRNQENGNITLHDLLHDYTRSKLGDQLVETHERLLTAYNPDNIEWWQIKHDGYLYHQLGYHLIGANKLEQFVKLIVAKPDWMEAKFIACQGDLAFVADIDLAMRQYIDPLDAADILIVSQLYVVRQIINVRTNIYTNDDLTILVWLNRTSEALNHARLRTDEVEKYTGLFAIYQASLEAQKPDESICSEMLLAVRELSDDAIRHKYILQTVQLLRKYSNNKHIALFNEALFNLSIQLKQDVSRLYTIASEVPINQYESSNLLIELCELRASNIKSAIYRGDSFFTGYDKSQIDRINEIQDQLLPSFISELIQDGIVATAIEICNVIKNESLFSHVVLELSQIADLKNALDVAERIETPKLRKAVFPKLFDILVNKQQYYAIPKLLIKSEIEDANIILPLCIKLLESRNVEVALECLECIKFDREANSWSSHRSTSRIKTSSSHLNQLKLMVSTLSSLNDSHNLMRLIELIADKGHSIDVIWQLLQTYVFSLTESGFMSEAFEIAENLDKSLIDLKLQLSPIELITEAERILAEKPEEARQLYKKAAELDSQLKVGSAEESIWETLAKLAETEEESALYYEQLYANFPLELLYQAIYNFYNADHIIADNLNNRFLNIQPDQPIALVLKTMLHSNPLKEEEYLDYVLDSQIEALVDQKGSQLLSDSIDGETINMLIDQLQFSEKLDAGMGSTRLVHLGAISFYSGVENIAKMWIIRALLLTPEDHSAWHWLSVIVPDVQDKIRCLNNALILDSNNESVQESIGTLTLSPANFGYYSKQGAFGKPESIQWSKNVPELLRKIRKLLSLSSRTLYNYEIGHPPTAKRKEDEADPSD